MVLISLASFYPYFEADNSLHTLLHKNYVLSIALFNGIKYGVSLFCRQEIRTNKFTILVCLDCNDFHILSMKVP